jgi:hypothetical protein
MRDVTTFPRLTRSRGRASTSCRVKPTSLRADARNAALRAHAAPLPRRGATMTITTNIQKCAAGPVSWNISQKTEARSRLDRNAKPRLRRWNLLALATGTERAVDLTITCRARRARRSAEPLVGADGPPFDAGADRVQGAEWRAAERTRPHRRRPTGRIFPVVSRGCTQLGVRFEWPLGAFLGPWGLLRHFATRGVARIHRNCGVEGVIEWPGPVDDENKALLQATGAASGGDALLWRRRRTGKPLPARGDRLGLCSPARPLSSWRVA